MVSRLPPSIQCRTVSIKSSAIFGDSGGMDGSSACVNRLNNRLLDASPGSITAPEAPPSISLAKLVMSSSPFFLSALWQEKHFARRIGLTCCSYVIASAPSAIGTPCAIATTSAKQDVALIRYLLWMDRCSLFPHPLPPASC